MRDSIINFCLVFCIALSEFVSGDQIQFVIDVHLSNQITQYLYVAVHF